MNTNTRCALTATTLAAVLMVAGCGGSGPGSGRLATTAAGAAGSVAVAASQAGPTAGAGGGGPTRPVRFVILTPPDFGPVDLVAGTDLGGARLATDLRPGTVTDYLPDGIDGITVVDQAGQLVTRTSGPETGADRATVVVGVDGDGHGTAETLSEAGGHVLDAASAPPDRTGKAVIVTDGYGLGPIAARSDSDVRLGVAARQCLPAVGDEPGPDDSANDPDPDGPATVVGVTSSAFEYVVPAGGSDLVWVTDADCRTTETAPAHVSLPADGDAYALAWFSSADHLRLLYVPVTIDGPGTTGVVDSGDGPTFSPTDHETIVDPTPAADPSDAPNTSSS